MPALRATNQLSCGKTFEKHTNVTWQNSHMKLASVVSKAEETFSFQHSRSERSDCAVAKQIIISDPYIAAMSNFNYVKQRNCSKISTCVTTAAKVSLVYGLLVSFKNIGNYWPNKDKGKARKLILQEHNLRVLQNVCLACC